MKISKRERLIPYWVLKNLRMYGNCACGYGLVKKHGRKKLLRTLDDFGYECTLRIVLDPNERKYKNLRYQPNAYYILELVRWNRCNEE